MNCTQGRSDKLDYARIPTGYLLAHEVDSDRFDLLDDMEMIRNEQVVGKHRLYWGFVGTTSVSNFLIKDDEGNSTRTPISNIMYKDLIYAIYGAQWWDEPTQKWFPVPGR